MARQSPPSRWRTPYLTLYNTLLSALWTLVLIRTLQYAPAGPRSVFTHVAPLARWTQTLSLLDIVHAATGLIPSAVGTTAIQVGTRTVQVWLWWVVPEIVLGGDAGAGWALVALLCAWGVADGVRYAWLAAKLHGWAGSGATWLRYSLFYPLYPVGIASEWWLMFRSIGPVGAFSPLLPPLFYGLLALYVPGAWVMFTHMVKQRKKVLAKERTA